MDLKNGPGFITSIVSLDFLKGMRDGKEDLST